MVALAVSTPRSLNASPSNFRLSRATDTGTKPRRSNSAITKRPVCPDAPKTATVRDLSLIPFEATFILLVSLEANLAARPTSRFQNRAHFESSWHWLLENILSREKLLVVCPIACNRILSFAVRLSLFTTWTAMPHGEVHLPKRK